MSIRKYEHSGNWLQIIPSVKGLATICDKDILKYFAADGENEAGRTGRPAPAHHELILVFTNRGTAGKDYEALCEAIDRLAGTRITTNIKRFEIFGVARGHCGDLNCGCCEKC